MVSSSDITTSSTLEPTASIDPSAMPMTSPLWMGLSCASLESLIAVVTSPVFVSANALVMFSTFSSSDAVSSALNSAENA